MNSKVYCIVDSSQQKLTLIDYYFDIKTAKLCMAAVKAFMNPRYIKIIQGEKQTNGTIKLSIGSN